MKKWLTLITALAAFAANNSMLLAQKGGFAWLQQGFSTDTVQGNGVTAIVGNEVIVVGAFTNSIEFDGSSESAGSAGSDDIFIASFDRGTGDLNWLSTAGGVSSDAGIAIAITPNLQEVEVCITGRFQWRSRYFCRLL